MTLKKFVILRNEGSIRRLGRGRSMANNRYFTAFSMTKAFLQKTEAIPNYADRTCKATL